MTSNLSKQIEAAMKIAAFEQLEDSKDFYGEIPGYQGVWASAPTLGECRDQLADALAAWLEFRTDNNL